MKSISKKFHLGDILSVVTGKLLSPTGMVGIYDILYYMTGHDLATPQLLNASRECKSKIFEQYPSLKKINASQVNRQNYKIWLDEQISQYGQYLDILPLPQGSYKTTGAVRELRTMVGNDKPIIVVG